MKNEIIISAVIILILAGLGFAIKGKVANNIQKEVVVQKNLPQKEVSTPIIITPKEGYQTEKIKVINENESAVATTKEIPYVFKRSEQEEKTMLKNISNVFVKNYDKARITLEKFESGIVFVEINLGKDLDELSASCISEHGTTTDMKVLLHCLADKDLEMQKKNVQDVESALCPYFKDKYGIKNISIKLSDYVYNTKKNRIELMKIKDINCDS